jgi:hypothetical protein
LKTGVAAQTGARDGRMTLARSRLRWADAWRAWAVLPLLVTSVLAPATARSTGEAAASGVKWGAQEEIRTLDGIPLHRIAVDTVDHEVAKIVLDGRVDEPVWSTLAPFDNMLVSIPATGQPGRYRTEARLFATERGLYVSAVLYQPPATLMTRRSLRDEFIDRDTFGVTLDTTGAGKFGYWFIVALGDTLMDGKVLPERNYSRDWDGTWIGRSARRTDGWSAEMFFPWSMMTLPSVDGPRTIGFAMSRQVSHENARYQWPGHAYSSSQFVSALNQMTIDRVRPRTQYSVIPFVAETIDERHDENKTRVGADLTWRPAPVFELAATAYPDFGSVEADEVVLNLTAQETFYPEKRVFFLEGNEVFETSLRANPGNQQRITTNENYATSSRRVFMNTFLPAPISLLNTRRIGGTPTQVIFPSGVTPLAGETALPTDLLGAAKVTGNTGTMRYGVLGASEEDVNLIGVDATGNEVHIGPDGRDFGALRFIYEHTGAAHASIGYLGTVVSGPLYDATVNGVDAHFTSGDGRWIAEGLFIDTDVDGVGGNGAQFEAQFAPNSRLQHRVTFDWFDETVNFNDMGFLQRNDYRSAQYAVSYANSNTGGRVTDIRGTLIAKANESVSEDYLVGDSGLFWRNSMVLPGRNTLRTGFGFRPGGWEDRDSRGNGAYETDDRVWSELLLATDASRRYSFSVNLGAQQENLGDWTQLFGVGLTWRPTGNISADFDVKYYDREGWIVYRGGRNFGRYDAADLEPTMKLNWFLAAGHQLNFILQWVGVDADEDGFYAVPPGDGELVPVQPTRRTDFTVSLMTMQVRYRWELAPLTDLYLVYNRGNTLPNQFDASLGELFDEAYEHPIVYNFVAKLRWRFGN